VKTLTRPNSKRLRQNRLTKNGIRGMPTGNANKHSEILLRQRTVQNFMTALALPDHLATGGQQQFTQTTIKLQCHPAAAGSASRKALSWR
jgi:hypothetical protein